MIAPKIRNLINIGIDIILPPRCPISGEIVDQQGMINPAIWRELSFISSPFCDSCGIPFEFGMEEGGQCLPCIENPPPYQKARSALRYDDTSKKLILGFKHGDKTHLSATFLGMLRQAGRELLIKDHIIIPVPLHKYRLIRRRYNQAAILGNALAKDCDLMHWPVALKRIRATQTQGHLNANERAKNVKKAFEVSPVYKNLLIGKDIILLDDVYTTGATLRECALVLKKANVASVKVLTIARVVRPE